MGNVENKTLRESLFFDFDIAFCIFIQDYILKFYGGIFSKAERFI